MFELDSTAITEDEPHRFSGCASDLGLPAGTWPNEIATKLGNELPFVLSRIKADSNVFVYKQSAGALVLTIFND